MRSDARSLAPSVAAATLMALASPLVANAQSVGYFDRDHNVSVLDRPRPEWQALGANVGTFSVFPSLTIAPEYDDNIFATSDNRTSDLVTAINPAVQVQSNWSRNSVRAFAQSTTDLYASHTDQNTTDYTFGGAGVLDILSASNINASASYSNSTIPRTAEDNITTAAKPVQYTQTLVTVGALQSLSRFRFTENFLYGKTSYNDNQDTGAGFNLTESNSDEYVFRGRADYALSPAFAIFISGEYNDKPYEEKPPEVPLDRSSTGYEVTAGADFDITSLVRGQIQLGYLSQDYSSTSFHTVSGPAVHANVEYFPTGLTTVTFSVNRNVVDAVDPLGISYLNTGGSVRVDHELLRNVILSGRAGYESDDFRGYDRDDRRITASVSGTYLINRHLGLTLGYSYLDENSTGTARIGNYYVDVVSLSLALRL